MALMFTFTAHLDLGTICEELATVKYKWRDIGLRLKVPYHKLKEFQKESNPLIEVINYWLSGNVKDVPVTWRSLVTVLESSSVDERGLAKNIMKKYYPSESTVDKGNSCHTCAFYNFKSFHYSKPGRNIAFDSGAGCITSLPLAWPNG